MNKIFRFKSVLLGALIVMCICGCGKSTAEYVKVDDIVVEETETKTIEEPTESVASTETETLLYVYVCGAIQKPGVYTVPEGSRVCDVFESAGGFTKDAATDYWNQARLLTDGEMIYVPTLEEVMERNLSSEASNSLIQSTDDKTGKVNINTASKEQLMAIPGVGEAKAQAILSYREANGSFSSIEEVMKVEGIKDGVFAKMKEYIVIN